jgi:hypothetical protein
MLHCPFIDPDVAIRELIAVCRFLSLLRTMIENVRALRCNDHIDFTVLHYDTHVSGFLQIPAA